MAEHNELGQQGEKIALSFLQEKGYRVLHVNWRHRRTEIDIIAMDGEIIVFVEVKTRHTSAFGEPENAVDFKKQRKLIHAANAYVLKHGIENDARFDVVSIINDHNVPLINHFMDAFYPTVQS
jgi:putative endonuclease